MTRWICITLLAALFLTGCQTNGWNPFERSDAGPVDSDLSDEEMVAGPALPAPGLAMSTEQRFNDIPLPVGLEPEPERTFVYESDALSVGRMVYRTKATVNELAQFYINEAPAANWKLQNVIEADGAQLVFYKADKRLTVGIQDLGFTRGRRLVLTMLPDKK